ncbi:hypothetical protein SLEP1_g30940 [Rubroshorea leprosula]|uniref:26S proteasome non-ATPase regulatory subunit 3 N-terminal TPR repeats domain-containing protein n=1 Tax=Rubroshorea leprosula TaxID=152421 RepID=A0AAV5K735_9ROSI|nr:hypothetical protein SLEP1_g30940 [Rubroshorea leprosula]
MEVDTATSSLQASAKHPLPELEIYCYLLVLIFLIDQKKYDEAKACSSASIARLKNVNRRTVDRQQQEQELAKHIAEEDDDEF